MHSVYKWIPCKSAYAVKIIITFNSLREESASIMRLPASPLPRLEEVPPRDARAAADRVGVAFRDDGCRKQENRAVTNMQIYLPINCHINNHNSFNTFILDTMYAYYTNYKT